MKVQKLTMPRTESGILSHQEGKVKGGHERSFEPVLPVAELGLTGASCSQSFKVKFLALEEVAMMPGLVVRVPVLKSSTCFLKI